MMLAMLLQGAVPATAIDAERALAAVTWREGQWTAMHRFAAPDAVMLALRPVGGRGDVTTSLPQPATPRSVRASCLPAEAAEPVRRDERRGAGASRNGTLPWERALNATGRTRIFGAYVWNGTGYADAIEDVEPAA